MLWFGLVLNIFLFLDQFQNKLDIMTNDIWFISFLELHSNDVRWVFRFFFNNVSSFLYWVWLGWKLTFTTVARIVLFSPLVARTVLMSNRSFVCCGAMLAQHQDSPFLSPSLPKTEDFGWARLGRGHHQGHWPKLTKRLFHTIWYNTQQ